MTAACPTSDVSALATAGTPALLALACDRRWTLAPHLKMLDRLAVRLARRDITRLLLCVPPRHGKSSYISKWLASWWLGCFPDSRVILASYAADLAAYWSTRAREVLEQYGPTVFGVTPAGSSVGWDIVGHPGGLRAVGVGGGITGFGADLLIADDLIKNAEEAQSETVRTNTWEWWTSTAYTRLEPGAVAVMIATRWHLDDPIGRILRAMEEDPKAERWELLSLPALAEADDPLGRQPGAALWPERYDVPALEQIRQSLGEHWFAALYQQRPVPLGGGMFKQTYFLQRVKAAPYQCQRIRFWDRAATADGGCYTAGVLLARDAEGNFYVEHVCRGRWEPGERDDNILAAAQRDRSRYGPHEPVIWVEQEPGSAGVDASRLIVRKLAGYRVRTERPTGNKEARAEPWASQCAAKNVFLVEDGSWPIAAFVEEHCSFPAGKYCDQVDAAAGAFAKLLAQRQILPLRTYNIGGLAGAKTIRIVCCTNAELRGLHVEQRTLLVCIADPDTVGAPEHSLDHLLGALSLNFLDIDPANCQAQWRDAIPPYGKTPEQLMFTRDQGRQLWGFLCKQRTATAEVLVITDDGGNRAISIALGVCDVYGLPRAEVICRLGEEKATKEMKPPNPHIHSLVKVSKSFVMGELPVRFGGRDTTRWSPLRV